MADYKQLFEPLSDAVAFRNQLSIQQLLDQRDRKRRKADLEESRAYSLQVAEENDERVRAREVDRERRREVRGSIDDLLTNPNMTGVDVDALTQLREAAVQNPDSPDVQRLLGTAQRRVADATQAATTRAADVDRKTGRMDQLFRNSQDRDFDEATVQGMLDEYHALSEELGIDDGGQLPRKASDFPRFQQQRAKQAEAETEATEADRETMTALLETYTEPLDDEIKAIESRMNKKDGYLNYGEDAVDQRFDDQNRLNFLKDQRDQLRDVERTLLTAQQPDTVNVQPQGQYIPPNPALKPAAPKKPKKASDAELASYVQALMHWNQYGDEAFIDRELRALGLNADDIKRIAKSMGNGA